MLIIGSLLVILASAASKNGNVFGMNGCEATPFPRVQVDTPVSEFFYSLQMDDIPGLQYNKEEGTVRLPMGQLMKGWYYHSAPIFEDLVDAGVFEWYFFPNPVSLFTHANWGTAENLMTVMKGGTFDAIIQEDLEKMVLEAEARDDDNYVFTNADKDRRKKVNEHAFLTMAQKQFADMSFDQKQTDQVIANPDPVPAFAPWRQKLKDALVDVSFPLSPPGDLDNDDKKIATNCLHGESPEYTDEYLIIELEKERVYSKGQTVFPLHQWANVAGRSTWKVNEELGTLELLFRGFQLGWLNAKDPNAIEVKYFQSPPHMKRDSRKNEDAPMFGNPNFQKPFCNLPGQIAKMEMDVHMLWEPVDKVCSQEKLDEFKKIILKQNFNTLVDHPKNYIKGMKLISTATDYVMCGNNYLRSYLKYSHGYDFLMAGAFVHFLLEFYPPFIVPFLTHKDLNQFKVDYIYGKMPSIVLNGLEETAVGERLGDKTAVGEQWGDKTAVGSFPDDKFAAEDTAVADPYYVAPSRDCWSFQKTCTGCRGYLDSCCTDSNCGNHPNGQSLYCKQGLYSYSCDKRRGEETALDQAVTMVDSAASGHSYAVNGFAFVGVATLLYGAYAHYFGKRAPGDNTQLQMA